ncbi:MFS transporter [Natrononativus amylolyticus]|uniref:MFS transporter n=1 Tax=Natrononativus amylolyticus TaxID=2963434 RepID=UPI0020CF269A|nr:MFS transporter [Natrononativus amylolyticus]
MSGQFRRLATFDVLLLTAAIWFLAKFLRYAFPPLFGPFQDTYGVSNTVLGLAFTAFMLVYAAMQFPSGVLADRLGSVTVITAGVVAAALAALALTVDSSFAVLVLAMVLMGAGTGAHKTVAVRLLARVYPSRTGRALGALDTFGTFGGVVAPAAVVAVAGVSYAFGASWRLVFLVAGVVGLALGAAFVLRVPDRLPDDPEVDPKTAVTGGGGLGRYARLFGEWRFTVFVLVTVLFSFTYNGLVAFAPLYLTEEGGLEATTASLLYSALFAVSLVQLVTGEVSDRIGTLPVIVCALAGASLGMVGLVSLSGSGSALALGGALVLVGLGSHGFRPVRGSYLMSAVPTEISGGGLGIVRTMLMGAGAVAPALVGYLSETAGFRPAFGLLAVSIAGATALSALLWVFDDAGT